MELALPTGMWTETREEGRPQRSVRIAGGNLGRRKLQVSFEVKPGDIVGIQVRKPKWGLWSHRYPGGSNLS